MADPRLYDKVTDTATSSPLNYIYIVRQAGPSLQLSGRMSWQSVTAGMFRERRSCSRSRLQARREWRYSHLLTKGRNHRDQFILVLRCTAKDTSRLQTSWDCSPWCVIVDALSIVLWLCIMVQLSLYHDKFSTSGDTCSWTLTHSHFVGLHDHAFRCKLIMIIFPTEYGFSGCATRSIHGCPLHGSNTGVGLGSYLCWPEVQVKPKTIIVGTQSACI